MSNATSVKNTLVETGRQADPVGAMLRHTRRLIEFDRACHPGRCQIPHPRRPRQRDLMIRPILPSRRIRFSAPEEAGGTLFNSMS